MSCSRAFYVFIATILVLGTSSGGAELTIDFDRRAQKAVVRGVVDGRALDAGVARATLQYRRSVPGPLKGEFVLRRHTIDDTIKEGDGQSIADIDGDGQNNIIVETGIEPSSLSGPIPTASSGTRLSRSRGTVGTNSNSMKPAASSCQSPDWIRRTPTNSAC